ncbi:MAG: spore coat protein CotJB [Eubacterium sp.]|jgi:spore coat protein JB|nr:spore coat protein CotJB [Eubacterium sp.]
MLRQNNMNRQQLFQWINEVSFAVTEISLYLDTHPDDADALDFFHHYNEERKKALELYSANYAPLTLDLMQQDDDHWLWATDPWPWEGGYC